MREGILRIDVPTSEDFFSRGRADEIKKATTDDSVRPAAKG